MTKVVLATRNQGKVRELQAMLEGQNIEVLGLDQFPWIEEVEETRHGAPAEVAVWSARARIDAAVTGVRAREPTDAGLSRGWPRARSRPRARGR